MEADRFDTNKFSELYALSRKAAPRILHIITRMKLVSPQCHDTMKPSAAGSVAIYAESPLPYPEGPEADGQIYDAMRFVAKLDQTLEETPTETFAVIPYPEEEFAQPLSIPGPRPRAFHTSREGPDRTSQRPGTTASSAASSSRSDACAGRRLSPTSGQIRLSFPAIPPRSPARSSNAYYSNDHLGRLPDFAAESPRYGGKEDDSEVSPSIQTRASTRSSTVVSSQSSVTDQHRGRESYSDIISPISSAGRGSVSSEKHGQSLQVPPLFARSVAENPSLPINGNFDVLAHSLQDVPDGLIPVDSEITELAPPLRPPPPVPEDCSITLSSSFYQFKGFCQGSMEMIQGGLGVRRIKKQVSPIHNTRDAVLARAHRVSGPFRRIQRGRQVQIVPFRVRMGGLSEGS